MVYVRLYSGMRLGNILRATAAGYKLAKDNGDEFTCIAPGYLFEFVEQFRDNILRNVNFIKETPKECKIYKVPGGTSYHQLPYEPNICIESYFVLEEYYDPDLSWELFKISQEMEQALLSRFPQLKTHTVCTISVRRGDYFKVLYFFNVCTLRFYKDAMKYMPADCVYIICSDDLKWCHRKFRGDKFLFADGLGATEQLYLQALAKHNIISNSSFSQFGTYLNRHKDKIVVAPKQWFGPYHKQPSSINYRKGWTIIDNTIPLWQRIIAWWQYQVVRRLRKK